MTVCRASEIEMRSTFRTFCPECGSSKLLMKAITNPHTMQWPMECMEEFGGCGEIFPGTDAIFISWNEKKFGLNRIPHDSRSMATLLYTPMSVKARELGYALTVHGSLNRDIDFVGIPWTNEAVSEREFAEAMMKVAQKVRGRANMGWSLLGKQATIDGLPGNKPHGRLGWNFVLGDGPYIDLAVMPRFTETATL